MKSLATAAIAMLLAGPASAQQLGIAGSISGASAMPAPSAVDASLSGHARLDAPLSQAGSVGASSVAQPAPKSAGRTVDLSGMAAGGDADTTIDKARERPAISHGKAAPVQGPLLGN